MKSKASEDCKIGKSLYKKPTLIYMGRVVRKTHGNNGSLIDSSTRANAPVNMHP